MATLRARLNAIAWYLAEKKVHPAVMTELRNITEATIGTTPPTKLGDFDTSNNVHLVQTGGAGFGPPASVQVQNPRVGPPNPDALSNKTPPIGTAGRFG